MEALGDFWNGEWDSFTAVFSSLQELDPSLNNSNSNEFQLPNNGGSQIPNNSWFYSLDAFDPNLQSSVKPGMSCSSCSTDHSSGPFFFANSSDLFLPLDEGNFGSPFLSHVLMEEVDKGFPAAGDRLIQNALDGNQQLPPPPPPQLVDSVVGGNDPIPLKRKLNNRVLLSDSQKKKTRVSADKKKTEQGKKNEKRKGENGEEEVNGEGQRWIGYSSEEENGTREGSGGSATRATRGSATDPQSLYARKRRERINERLKMLQKLVPNGTKVDISTMLEEAVHYVKFLQLQIKLLSSDDMWMFAPLAYNGMDIGLHQKFSPFLSH